MLPVMWAFGPMRTVAANASRSPFTMPFTVTVWAKARTESPAALSMAKDLEPAPTSPVTVPGTEIDCAHPVRSPSRVPSMEIDRANR